MVYFFDSTPAHIAAGVCALIAFVIAIYQVIFVFSPALT